jgi:hypothetical protein
MTAKAHLDDFSRPMNIVLPFSVQPISPSGSVRPRDVWLADVVLDAMTEQIERERDANQVRAVGDVARGFNYHPAGRLCAPAEPAACSFASRRCPPRLATYQGIHFAACDHRADGPRGMGKGQDVEKSLVM